MNAALSVAATKFLERKLQCRAPCHTYKKMVGAVHLYGEGHLEYGRCSRRNRVFEVRQTRYTMMAIRRRI